MPLSMYPLDVSDTESFAFGSDNSFDFWAYYFNTGLGNTRFSIRLGNVSGGDATMRWAAWGITP